MNFSLLKMPDFHQDAIFLPFLFQVPMWVRRAFFKNKTCLYVLVLSLVRNSLCQQCAVTP